MNLTPGLPLTWEIDCGYCVFLYVFFFLAVTKTTRRSGGFTITGKDLRDVDEEVLRHNLTTEVFLEQNKLMSSNAK